MTMAAEKHVERHKSFVVKGLITYAVLAHGRSLTLLVDWHSSRHTLHSVLLSRHATLPLCDSS